MNPHYLWAEIALPLVKLLLSVSVGLLVGNLIEAMNWSRLVARMAGPLARFGHMKDVTGASFSMAFFSNISANAMLAEAYDQGRIDRRELIISNLFNSLPTYFLHLPTMFFVVAPFIKDAAFTYIGLTILAAFLRTVGILLVSRAILPESEAGCPHCHLAESGDMDFRAALAKTWTRFKARLPRLVFMTIPIYLLFHWLTKSGAFTRMEHGLAGYANLIAWLPPQAIGIVVFHIVAEFSAGMAAAGAAMGAGSLSAPQIIMALLIGNILSTPMRAIRHQFPYYAGIFKARTALELILHNQALRASSLILVTVAYHYAAGL